MYILFCANDYMTDSFVQELIFAQLVRTEPFSFGMLAVAHIFSPTYFRIFFRPWLQHKNLDWTVEHFLGHILCILYIILICSYMTRNCYKYLVKPQEITTSFILIMHNWWRTFFPKFHNIFITSKQNNFYFLKHIWMRKSLLHSTFYTFCWNFDSKIHFWGLWVSGLQKVPGVVCNR